MNIGSATDASLCKVCSEVQVNLQKSSLKQEEAVVSKLLDSTESSAPRGDTGLVINEVA